MPHGSHVAWELLPRPHERHAAWELLPQICVVSVIQSAGKADQTQRHRRIVALCNQGGVTHLFDIDLPYNGSPVAVEGNQSA